MYRTPFASIRVPDVDDIDLRQGLLNTFTDIQYEMDSNTARMVELQRRRGGAVTAAYGAAMASGVSIAVTWGTVDYDSDNYVDLAVSVNNIVVPRGLFAVTASAIFTGTGAINTAQIAVFGSAAGAIAATQAGAFGSAGSATLSTVGLLYSYAGENVTLNAVQVSGGAGVFVSGKMAVAKIGNL